MIKYCRKDNESVLAKIKAGQLDYAHMSFSNLTDDIISDMNSRGILQCLEDGIDDIRSSNYHIPFKLILGFVIAAKMKHKMSLTDIPTAITDHRLLGELGFNLIDTDGNLGASLMKESSLRYLIQKYEPFNLVNSYSNTVQNYIMPKLNLTPSIHILDCTTVEVNLNNKNYEWSAIGKDKDGKTARGYSLATLRGIAYDTGFIEDIRFGQLSDHDIDLSRDMMLNSPVLKSGDILICDRGFIDRKTSDYLKIHRNVDTYQPLKKNMLAYKEAVRIAKEENKWTTHPNRNRKNQKISFVPNLGCFWENKNEKSVDINTCVVWDLTKDEYFVFMTTDLSKSAKQIIKTYELRPEIEEQYRQLKEFWGLEDFTCKKLSEIIFHIVFTLFAYLFFELYTMFPEGEKYAHQSLPILLKKYNNISFPYIVLYIESLFGIFTLVEYSRLYAACCDASREQIEAVLIPLMG